MKKPFLNQSSTLHLTKTLPSTVLVHSLITGIGNIFNAHLLHVIFLHVRVSCMDGAHERVSPLHHSTRNMRVSWRLLIPTERVGVWLYWVIMNSKERHKT